MHVASGAAAGAVAGTRGRALAVGPVLHLLGDMTPHRDIRSRRFELRSGVALVLLLALRRGPFDPAVIGALAASAPDVEHVLPLPRPGGRKLFPSHRIPGLHRSGGLGTGLQLVAAGVLIGAVLAGRRPPGAAAES